jgi:hypothetical protein
MMPQKVKIRTLRQWPRKSKFLKPASNGERPSVIAAQHVSAFQIQFPNGRYEQVHVGGRGYLATTKGRPTAFDIATAPVGADSIKDGVLAILREKAINDQHAANILLQRLRDHAEIPLKHSLIDMADIAAALLCPFGQVACQLGRKDVRAERRRLASAIRKLTK